MFKCVKFLQEKAYYVHQKLTIQMKDSVSHSHIHTYIYSYTYIKLSLISELGQRSPRKAASKKARMSVGCKGGLMA